MADKKILLVVGASAGGTATLPELLKQLPAGKNISVMLVLHLFKNVRR
jgi:chemotaxis response regulator CheB